MSGTRRLAAIMFTDIAGYTSLSQTDERGARGLLQDQERLVRGLLEVHRGRLVKSMGDGLLIEFSNALDAVAYALDLQRHIRERNAREPPPELCVRIGIHLGDVEGVGTDILGDAVNVASRIEPIAEPGGIAVSASVELAVRNKLALRATTLGPKQLKGVLEPIEVYAISPATPAAPPAPAPAGPNRVAVLPFANISPHADDAYIADGMTEELTVTMSKIHGLTVLARTSVLRYRGGDQNIEEIARDLRAQYILEGSVRKAGDKIRITAQLIRAADGGHLWSETFDRDMGDLFTAQSEIARSVARTMEVTLLRGEGERVDHPPTRNTVAHALYLRGIAYNANDYDKEDSLIESVKCLERAVELDPGFASAYAYLADGYVSLYVWAEEHWPWERSMVPAEAALAKALALDPDLAETHRSAGLVAYFRKDLQGAERECRKAVELNPSDAWSHAYLSATLSTLGRDREASEEGLVAVGLAPLDRAANQLCAHALIKERRYPEAIDRLAKMLEFDTAWGYGQHQLGTCYMRIGSYDQAIAPFQKFVEQKRSDHALAHLASAYAATGRTDEAARLVEELVAPSRPRPALAHYLALVYVASGKTDEAIATFERAFNEGDSESLDQLRDDADFDGIRTDARIVSVLSRQRGALPPDPQKPMDAETESPRGEVIREPPDA